MAIVEHCYGIQSMKYSFNLKISNNKRELKDKLVIGAFANESGPNIALKLLAYLLFIEKKPRIDEDAGWQIMPDLIAKDESGEIILWVDCGGLSTKKIDLITTKGRDRMAFYVFRKNERDMDSFYLTIKDKIKHLENVKCVSFDDGFVDGIGEALDRTNELEGYIGDDMISLTLSNSFRRHEAYSSIHRINPE